MEVSLKSIDNKSEILLSDDVEDGLLVVVEDGEGKRISFSVDKQNFGRAARVITSEKVDGYGL